MQEFVKKPQNTPDNQPKASRQAPASMILQNYMEDRQSYAPNQDNESLQSQFDTTELPEFDDTEPPQDKAKATPPANQEPIQPSKRPNNTGLPDDLKTNIENHSGYSLDDVRVYPNSDKPAQLNAAAYTQGTDIYLAPGQEKRTIHEVCHILQKKQGRVSGEGINEEEELEQEAEAYENELKQTNKDQTPQYKKGTANNIIQRYLIVDSTDYTKRYYDFKNRIEASSKYDLEAEITAIAIEMIKSLTRVQSTDEQATEIIAKIRSDTDNKLRTQLRKWIIDETGEKVQSRNKVFGRKYQPRVYTTYNDLAHALIGWVEAKPGRKEEKVIATKVLENKSISYHLDEVFIKIGGFITSQPKKDEILDEIINQKTISTDINGAPLILPKRWAIYKTYFDTKTQKEHMLPKHIDILKQPGNYSIREKIGVLHDLMHYFYEKWAGRKDGLLTGLTITASTLGINTPIERSSYLRPESSQIRGDIKKVKEGTLTLDLSEPSIVKYSTEETHPSFIFARKHLLPMYGRHSYSAARMMGLARKAGASNDEIEAVAWAIMAYWRVHYDHTKIPYHTLHEIMDMAPAFGIPYNPLDQGRKFEKFDDSHFISVVIPSIKRRSPEASVIAILNYKKTPFEKALFFLNHNLWNRIPEVNEFLQTTSLPDAEYYQLPVNKLQLFFSYSSNQELFNQIPEARQEFIFPEFKTRQEVKRPEFKTRQDVKPEVLPVVKPKIVTPIFPKNKKF